MNRSDASPQIRLEEALRLLPNLDSLAELRESLVRRSRLRSASEPEATLGKREIHAVDLQPLLRDAVEQSTGHLTRLYEVAIDALNSLQRLDHPSAVRSLLQAGEFEEHVGRHSEALQWYRHALEIARPLRERQPEIEVLCHVGRLQMRRDRFEEAARCFQRALALAEAESDAEHAALACQGLGDLALAQSRWPGAEAWFKRGLHHADGNGRCKGGLLLSLAEAARHRGEHDTALRHVLIAWEKFESIADGLGMARVLNESGRLHRLRGHLEDASTLHQQALAQLRRIGGNLPLEIAIRLDLAQLYFDWGRLGDAEEECRQAEKAAIAGNRTRELAQCYLLLGRLRAESGHDSAFIFFENAIALCRGREPLPRLEAEVYLEYGLSRQALGDEEESRAYVLRARELLESLGEDALLTKVRTKLAQFGLS
jgi:tetratricopeptide (TPR) repeat protein